jgi:hypothetical protein
LNASEPIATPTNPTNAAIVSNLPPLWYLGIDLGETISAVLFNRRSLQCFAINWQLDAIATPELPTVVSVIASDLDQPDLVAVTIGASTFEPAQTLVLSDFLPALKRAIPYRSAATWQPIVQWTEQALPLKWLQLGLATLLATLNGQASQASICTATGLAAEELQAALSQLTGVILSSAASDPDAYRFNLREAVLAAGLVSQAEQIFFLESSIATWLTELPQTDAVQRPLGHTVNAHASRQGATLVLTVGAATTELLLAQPPQTELLTREDCYLRSVGYGVTSLEQDIIGQLLYPALSAADRASLPDLELPVPGESDLPVRDRLQQQLRSTPLGQQLWQTAHHLQHLLAQPNSEALSLPSSVESTKREALQRRVLLPYVQQLNRELNVLLSQSGIDPMAINQAIYTGDAVLPAIVPWLKQKLPNAIVIQDGSASNSQRVALGLALMSLVPQMFDATQHQYGDLFLLREILQAIPSQPLSFAQIHQRLENQGIHTQFCQRLILRLLEGALPAGLASESATDAPLFSKQGNQYLLNAVQRDRLLQQFSAILATAHQTLADPLPCTLLVNPDMASSQS